MIDSRLVDFLKKEIKNGHSEEFLRQGLVTKGWPIDTINDSIKAAKGQINLEAYIPTTPRINVPSIQEVKRISDKPIIHKPKFDRNVLVLSIIMFLVVSVILTFTSLVFFYMNGVMDYTIYDPVTNQQLKRTCIYENCQDLRDFALNFAKTKITLSIIIGIITSLIIVVIYNLISFKKVFLWVIQILFLLFLLIMGYMWFAFTRGK